MCFKRSTRSIVTRGRAKEQNQSPGAEASLEEVCSSGKTTFSKISKHLPRWAVPGGIALLGLLCVGILAAVLFANSNRSSAPTPSQGTFLVAVSADASLAGQILPGDVVRLYTADGQPIAELGYVQVYRITDSSSLLLLVDERQSEALVKLDSAPKVVLAVHDDPKQAAEVLALQGRINAPEISVTLQQSASLTPGEVLELEHEFRVQPEEAVYPPLVWSTSDPAVVTVEGGTLTAHGVGSAAVTLSFGSKEAVCQVEVKIPLEKILLDKQEVKLTAGETAQLTASGEPADATGFTVTWVSSDPAVATAAEDGTVTAVAPGTATITATCGEISASCAVTVGVHAELVQLDKQALTLAVGQTDKLTASVYPGTGVIDSAVFESSDTNIITVAGDGTVTAAAPGTATITFRCGEAAVSCTVTVTEAPAQ